jgi:nitrate/nitrite transport system substrate-binding protein
VRDKLANGELHAAHVLYGLVYGLHLGVGGPKKDMAVLMTLNNNGQAITLSNALKDKGAVDGASLAKVIAKKEKEYTFAQTFPTGTHAMWLYYWLAAHGIDPFKDVKNIVVPPSADGRQHARRQHGRLTAGEPGTSAPSWTRSASPRDHPGHLDRPPREGAGRHRRVCRQVPQHRPGDDLRILEASKLDRRQRRQPQQDGRDRGRQELVNTDVDVIRSRMIGQYENGLGKSWSDKNYMKFYNDGLVNYPYLSDGMWFLTQHRRWGLLKQDVDYLAWPRPSTRPSSTSRPPPSVACRCPSPTSAHSKLIDGVCGTARTRRNTPPASRSTPDRWGRVARAVCPLGQATPP